MNESFKKIRFVVAALIAACPTLSVMSAAENPPSWKSLVTPTVVIGQSSGYQVSYKVLDGVNPTQLSERLRTELQRLVTERSSEKWLPLPGFENDDLRLVDVVALIYADVTKREMTLSYWDDVKQRDKKIATLLSSRKGRAR
jgi:hypothetical protein